MWQDSFVETRGIGHVRRRRGIGGRPEECRFCGNVGDSIHRPKMKLPFDHLMGN